MVRVSRFSLIRVLNNHYSVPSRLIGATLKVRIRSEILDLYHGPAHVLTLPRMTGRNQRRIDYRHLIWSLVRKPGAFAAYCYRDELFPTTTFRRAYDALLAATPTKADREYLRLLHLAASTTGAEVDQAIVRLMEDGRMPTLEAVRELVTSPAPTPVPKISKAAINLSDYNALIPSWSSHA
jgi:hypothetical protein